jgi:hypothetical protein
VAGLGYKQFTAGEVLQASELQGYAVDQSVMVFASSAARSSALPSPTEGMVSYLKDTDSTEYYSGASWQSLGGAEIGFEQTFLLMGA